MDGRTDGRTSRERAVVAARTSIIRRNVSRRVAGQARVVSIWRLPGYRGKQTDRATTRAHDDALVPGRCRPTARCDPGPKRMVIERADIVQSEANRRGPVAGRRAPSVVRLLLARQSAGRCLPDRRTTSGRDGAAACVTSCVKPIATISNTSQSYATHLRPTMMIYGQNVTFITGRRLPTRATGWRRKMIASTSLT